MRIRQLSRRFLAQLLDAVVVLHVSVTCFHGTALSPFQHHTDHIAIQPFPLVPLASALHLSFDLAADPTADHSSWMRLLLDASGNADEQEDPLFRHTTHWPSGTRATFTLKPFWSRGLLLLWLVYSTLCTGYCGQTAGKRLMGLRVTQKDGAPVGYVRSFVRSLVYVPCAAMYVALVWLLFGIRGRWWHDWVAETRVVGA